MVQMPQALRRGLEEGQLIGDRLDRVDPLQEQAVPIAKAQQQACAV